MVSRGEEGLTEKGNHVKGRWVAGSVPARAQQEMRGVRYSRVNWNSGATIINVYSVNMNIYFRFTCIIPWRRQKSLTMSTGN